MAAIDPVTDGAPLSWRIRERPGMTTVEFVGEIDVRCLNRSRLDHATTS